MADNTATFVLDGEVPLEEFAKAISAFSELIRSLSDESGDSGVEWVIDDLSVSSAMATIAGTGDEKHVQKVLTDYSTVGQSLLTKAEIRHSERTKAAANKIISISDARIPSVRFETAKREVIIPLRQELPDSAELTDFDDLRPAIRPILSTGAAAFGAVQGRIQMLSSRGRLRFTLYDLFYDKAVSCYFADGKQELLRGLWGRMALVEGFIKRDPVTGRPLHISEVSNITPLSESAGRFDYQVARGAAVPSIAISPEEAIRRIRDAQ